PCVDNNSCSELLCARAVLCPVVRIRTVYAFDHINQMVALFWKLVEALGDRVSLKETCFIVEYSLLYSNTVYGRIHETPVVSCELIFNTQLMIQAPYVASTSVDQRYEDAQAWTGTSRIMSQNNAFFCKLIASEYHCLVYLRTSHRESLPECSVFGLLINLVSNPCDPSTLFTLLCPGDMTASSCDTAHVPVEGGGHKGSGAMERLRRGTGEIVQKPSMFLNLRYESAVTDTSGEKAHRYDLVPNGSTDL
ncbi:hypothetical protein STEG23_003845, partial [Scotinomys teguina]